MPDDAGGCQVYRGVSTTMIDTHLLNPGAGDVWESTGPGVRPVVPAQVPLTS